MNTLNEKFKFSCETVTSKIINEDENIYRIKNFFKHPIEAKNFLLSLPAWDCDELDLNTKPGMEIILPTWVDKYLMKEIFKLNNINFVTGDNVIINMHYYGMPKKGNSFRSSNGTFDLPHHDYISGHDGLDCFVLLVNLNEYDIFTNFWTFNDKIIMDNYDYELYFRDFESKNKNKDLNSLEIPDKIKLYKQIKYKFNEAIIYNASILHNAKVIKKYTRKNPRVTLRYMFYEKKLNNLTATERKNITYQ